MFLEFLFEFPGKERKLIAGMRSHNALFAKSTSAGMRAPVWPSVMICYARFLIPRRILRTSSQTRGPLIRLPPNSLRSCIRASGKQEWFGKQEWLHCWWGACLRRVRPSDRDGMNEASRSHNFSSLFTHTESRLNTYFPTPIITRNVSSE